MNKFFMCEPDGRIHTVCGRESDLLPMPRDGYIFRLWRPMEPPEPPTPTSAAYWVGGIDGEPQWVEMGTIDEAHAEAWTVAKIARDRAEAAPFEFDGGMYDPNKENIAGAALAALMAQLQGIPVLRRWTLADNTCRDLTGEQIIALGLALTERVDAIHERGRQLRDLINAAATPAEAYGYTWDSLDA